MPMPSGGRYRVMKTKTGTRVRLHFGPGGRVNESLNMDSGARHTPSDFAADAAKRKKRRGSSLAQHLTSMRLSGAFATKRRAPGPSSYGAGVD